MEGRYKNGNMATGTCRDSGQHGIHVIRFGSLAHKKRCIDQRILHLKVGTLAFQFQL